MLLTFPPRHFSDKRDGRSLQAVAGNESSGERPAKRRRGGEVEPGMYVIQRLLDHGRDAAGDIEFVVKWLHWPDNENSAVSMSEVGHDSDLVREYIRLLGRQEKAALYSAGLHVSCLLLDCLLLVTDGWLLVSTTCGLESG